MEPQTKTSRPGDSIRFWPRLSRFYGLTFAEIAAMPYAAIRVYLDAIDGLQAEEHLLRIQAACFPHYDEAGQRRTHRFWIDLSGDGGEPEAQAPPDPVALGAMGIRVVKESA